ncbi:MAG: hypothetical protein ACI4AH_04580 [Muribaculaceae bacterium]
MRMFFGVWFGRIAYAPTWERTMRMFLACDFGRIAIRPNMGDGQCGCFWRVIVGVLRYAPTGNNIVGGVVTEHCVWRGR